MRGEEWRLTGPAAGNKPRTTDRTGTRRLRQTTKGESVSRSEDDFKTGDDVTWRTHGTTTHGTVEKKITEDTEAAGRTVRASDDDPQYLVRSDKSGKTAVHKPDALDPDGKSGS